MKTIEITTTQKVTIDYELALLRDRIFAYMLDVIIMLGIYLVLLLLIMGAIGDEAFNIFQYFVATPLFLFYTLVSEILMDGQTIGKKALGIKVIKLNGKAPTINDYLLRWAFRMVDIYFSVGTIASLLISSSEKGQRLGDITANTTLIKIKFNLRFRLEDIENIGTVNDYTPTYTQIRQLSEKDMLSIKEVVTRYRKYPNESHREVVRSLVEHLTVVLDLDEVPKNKLDFLKTLIRDYIVLTR